MSILVIAGSDSIAGAGLQVDLKVASALGVYATCACTVVTAQNTRGVQASSVLDPADVTAQIRSVFADVPPQAVKVGALGDASVAHAVAAELACHPDVPVVLDPVLVATSGLLLAGEGTVDVLLRELVPLAAVVTPNLPEARALTGVDVSDDASARAAADVLVASGAGAVFLKGGHGNDPDTCTDRLYVSTSGGLELTRIVSRRLPGEFHGTGCSTATAIACGLSVGEGVVDAVHAAQSFVAGMLERPVPLGTDPQLVNPLYRFTDMR